jgi:ABC-type uncharacterized transport system fused permease/ATPase subunit
VLLFLLGYSGFTLVLIIIYMSDSAVKDEVMEEVSKKKDSISKSKPDQSADARGKMKVQSAVEKLYRAKDDLRDVKNALKAWKVTSERLEELRKVKKEIGDEFKEEKERIEREHAQDADYNTLREEKLDKEEQIALSKRDLRVALEKETIEKGMAEIEVEVDGHPVKLQTQVKVELYFNGVEEK